MMNNMNYLFKIIYDTKNVKDILALLIHLNTLKHTLKHIFIPFVGSIVL